MNKKLYSTLVALSILSIFGFTSCLDDKDTGESWSYVETYCTLGSAADNYAIYADGGGTIYLNDASIALMTQDKSPLKNAKRAYLFARYLAEDFTNENGNVIVRNAELLDGAAIRVQSMVSAADAAEKGITAADSLFDIKTISSAWAYNGYMTIAAQMPYSVIKDSICPISINLVYNPEWAKENEVDLHLCLNRHTSKQNIATAGPANSLISFTIEELNDLVPGNDTIRVNLVGQGVSNKVFKVARSQMHILK